MYNDEPEWSWRYEAKCRGVDTEIFFPPRDKEQYAPIADRAKAVCNGKDGLPPCPVKKECLIYAIESDEQHGIWGGLSHRERNAMVRKYKKADKSLEEWLE